MPATLTLALGLSIGVPAHATVSQDEAAVSEKLSVQTNEFLATLLGPGRAKAVVMVEGESAQSSSQSDSSVPIPVPAPAAPPDTTPVMIPGYNKVVAKEMPKPSTLMRHTLETSWRDGGLKITRIQASVILDDDVPKEKAASVQDLLPDFLHLNMARGDELKVMRAPLHHQDWKTSVKDYAQSKEGLRLATIVAGGLILLIMGGLLTYLTTTSAIRTFMKALAKRHDPTTPDGMPPSPELLSDSTPSLSLDEEGAEDAEKPAEDMPMLGHRFDFLTSVPTADLVKIVAEEPAKDMALLMATLTASHPDLSATVFAGLAPNIRGAISVALAGLTRAAPEEIDEVERRLKMLIDHGVRGAARLGDLLSRLPEEERNYLMMEIARAKPDVAKELERMMFSFEDIIHLKDAELRRLILGVPYADWGLALRGAPPMIVDRVLAELDAGNRGEMKTAMSVPHPRMKVLEARSKVISRMLALVAGGEIVIQRDAAASEMI